MIQNSRNCILFTWIALVLLASIGLANNYFYLKFLGNNYFPPNILIIILILLFILLGCYLQFGSKSLIVKMVKELIYYFLILGALALATNAIQFTPFRPVDEQLIRFEAVFHINIVNITSWTINQAWLVKLLVPIYDSLPYQMSILPIVSILMRKFSYLREYYCLFLISALIGFSIYYFFPTLGPAMSTKASLFSPKQYATGIKFMEIHQHLLPSTREGGMIALPSFHVIWAVLCIYLIRWSSLLYLIFLPINLLLIISCVLLGWHYPIDLVASFLVLIITYCLCFYCGKINNNSWRELLKN